MKVFRISILAAICFVILSAVLWAEVGYTLKEGETLSDVASKFHVSLQDLLKINNIDDQEAVEVGDRLVIPYPDSEKSHSIFDLSSAEESDIDVSISVEASKIKGQNLLDLSEYDEKVVEITNKNDSSESDKTEILKDAKSKLAPEKNADSDTLKSTSKLKDVGYIEHIVVKGDTIEKLAKVYKVSQNSIFNTNRLSKRTILKIGQKIKIPNPAKQGHNADLEDGIVSRNLTKRDQLARYALKFVGLRYRYGQSDLDNGTDCSGFTMKVYERFGINLPHSSLEQSAIGKPVNKNALVPGDLVFFKTNGKTISHVGIYIGDGNFIHNTRTRGVVMIDQLSDSYYAQRFACARRIF